MILVDFSPLVFSGISFINNNEQQDDVDRIIRQIVLSQIKNIKKRFNDLYGEMIICYDSRISWRNEEFKNYKIRRRLNKKKDEKTKEFWDRFFGVLNTIKEEMREILPYKIIEVNRAEADDIIAVLLTLSKKDELNVIISRDSDFIQLHNMTTCQWDPIEEKYIHHDDPHAFLIEHIISGDAGDDIPNILSDSDTFVVSGKRQKSLTAAKKKILIDHFSNSSPISILQDQLITQEIHDNFIRNEKLIDLDKIPYDVRSEIIEKFGQYVVDRKKLLRMLTYCIKYRLENLTGNIQEF